MSGLGKGAKGIGKGGIKRHRKLIFIPLPLAYPTIRRLARRGGVHRISGLVYHEARQGLRHWLEDVLHGAVIHLEHTGKKTITALDILHTLRLRGHSLYGYGY